MTRRTERNCSAVLAGLLRAYLLVLAHKVAGVSPRRTGNQETGRRSGADGSIVTGTPGHGTLARQRVRRCVRMRGAARARGQTWGLLTERGSV